MDEYFRHCFEERQAPPGRRVPACCRSPAPSSPIRPTTAASRAALCVWHPHGTTETEAWRFFLVDADAPAAVKDVLRRFYMRYSGPAGMTEQDDMENWLYATTASQGPIARRHPFNYQQSIGAYRHGDPLPGDVATQMTEQNARNYYRIWRAYLKAIPGRSCSAAPPCARRRSSADGRGTRPRPGP